MQLICYTSKLQKKMGLIQSDLCAEESRFSFLGRQSDGAGFFRLEHGCSKYRGIIMWSAMKNPNVTSATTTGRPPAKMFESLDPETQVVIRISVKHLKAARFQDISWVFLCGNSARGDYVADIDIDMAVVLGSTNEAMSYPLASPMNTDTVISVAGHD